MNPDLKIIFQDLNLAFPENIVLFCLGFQEKI